MNRKEEMKRFLTEKMLELANRKKRMVNDNEFAAWLTDQSGYPIASASLNAWRNGNRLPDGDNLHALAYVYGSEVYEIAGKEAFVPSGALARKIADKLPELSPEDRAEILRIIERNDKSPQLELALQSA